MARARGVLAGGAEAATLFRLLHCSARQAVRDGDGVAPGTTVLVVRGPARALLLGERTALNIIMRMSGIATATRDLVTRCRAVNPRVVIAATRKTAPGSRYLDKRAVAVGGGDPHRFGLDDSVLIKDNHLRFRTIREAVALARRVRFRPRRGPYIRSPLLSRRVEVEAATSGMAVEAAEAGADAVLLDNMTPAGAARATRAARAANPRILIEVSGGITPRNILRYAPFADVVSLGWLTHSARALDLSLEIPGNR